MKVMIIRLLLSFCTTADNTQSCYFHILYYSKTVKQQLDFPFSKKTINYQSLQINFPAENGNFEDEKKLLAELDKEKWEE